MTRKPQTGLTLVEILIAIAILMVLVAAILIPSYSRVQKNAYDMGALNCAKTVQQAQTEYHSRTFEYASTPTELELANFTPCQPVENYPILASEATPTNYVFTIKHINGPTLYDITNQRITQHIPAEEN